MLAEVVACVDPKEMAGGAPRKSGGVIPRKIIIIAISLDWRKSAEVGVVKSRKSFLEFVVSFNARSSLYAGPRSLS